MDLIAGDDIPNVGFKKVFCDQRLKQVFEISFEFLTNVTVRKLFDVPETLTRLESTYFNNYILYATSQERYIPVIYWRKEAQRSYTKIQPNETRQIVVDEVVTTFTPQTVQKLIRPSELSELHFLFDLPQ